MTDPIALFSEWLDSAHAAEPGLAEAVALATADATGMPSVRMVLLKGHGADGFMFYTNLESQKGRELAANPRAALCFHWKSLRRQVRVSGDVEPVSDALADAYFQSRDRGSKLGAWASKQSAPLASRLALEQAVARTAEQYPAEIPRPSWWSGFRLIPSRIEFWEELPYRLHRRVRFDRADAGWAQQLLYP